jgi:outer membrane murein-binding lipoprotein Lpp
VRGADPSQYPVQITAIMRWGAIGEEKNMRLLILAVVTAPLLAGCISAVKTVVTAPVKAVGQVADWSTTSQDESDRNRGREMRKREEELGKLSRQRDKAAEKCRDGNEDQCQRAEVLDHEIEALMAAPR